MDKGSASKNIWRKRKKSSGRIEAMKENSAIKGRRRKTIVKISDNHDGLRL